MPSLCAVLAATWSAQGKIGQLLRVIIALYITANYGPLLNRLPSGMGGQELEIVFTVKGPKLVIFKLA